MIRHITLNNESVTVPTGAVWYVITNTLSLLRSSYLPGETVSGTGVLVVDEFMSEEIQGAVPVITPTVPSVYRNWVWDRFSYNKNTTSEYTLVYEKVSGSDPVSALVLGSYNSRTTINNFGVLTIASGEFNGGSIRVYRIGDTSLAAGYESVEIGLESGEILTLPSPEIIAFTPDQAYSSTSLLDYPPTSPVESVNEFAIPSVIDIPITIPSLSHTIDITHEFNVDVYGQPWPGGISFVGPRTAMGSVSLSSTSGSAIRQNYNTYPCLLNSNNPFTVQSEGVTSLGHIRAIARGTHDNKFMYRDVEVRVNVTVGS